MREDTAPGLVPEAASNTLLSSDKGKEETMSISPEDISCLTGFLRESIDRCNATSTLENINSILAKAVVAADTGQKIELVAFFDLLHPVLETLMDREEVVQAWIEQENEQAHVFEILCRVVVLTVVLLAKHNSPDCTIGATDTRYLLISMEALCIVFSKNCYYTLRKEKGIWRNLPMLLSRRDSVWQAPGNFVNDGVAKKGINQRGRDRTKGCCDSQEEHDAVLVHLSCLMGRSAYGNAYIYIIEMLTHPKDFTLRMIQLLLYIISMLGFVSVEDNPFCEEDCMGRKILFSIPESSFDSMCQSMFQYLKEAIDALDSEYSTDAKHVVSTVDSMNSVVEYLDSISYLGSRTNTVDLAGQLQISLWKLQLKKKMHWAACASIGEAIELIFSKTSCRAILSPADFSRWLNDEDIIIELLNFDYDLVFVPEVEEFVSKISKKGLLQQQHLVRLLQSDNSGKEHTEPHDLIVASVLDCVHHSAISTEVLTQTIRWLEHAKTMPQIPGQRIISILEKLAMCDKDKSLKERVLNSFWKHTGHAPPADLANSLTKVADHYEPVHEFQSLRLDSVLQGEGEKDFLQTCLSADADTKFKNYLTGANNQSTSYVERAKVWKEKELEFYLSSLPNLEQLLAFDIPFSRHDMSSECLKRLDFSQHLVAGLQSPSQSTLASAMALAMSPEMQTLEEIQKESGPFLEIDKKIQELNLNHFKLYEMLKEEQHERLVEFFKACRREKQIVAREALYAKAKVAACKKRAQLNADAKMSSDAILSRMLQKAEGVVKELEENHKKRLEKEKQKAERLEDNHTKRLEEEKQKIERLEDNHTKRLVEEKQKVERLMEKPKPHCALCSQAFHHSTYCHNTERACLSPCGHAKLCYRCAQSCFQAASIGRGKCPFCQTDISSISKVPSLMLF